MGGGVPYRFIAALLCPNVFSYDLHHLQKGGGAEVCGQQKQSNDPSNNQHILNTPIIGLTRKRHTMPHSAQSQHANYWAP